MLANKTVRNVNLTDFGATVNCEDGSSYMGDIVIGCDGVNSKASIRNEMCRLARGECPENFPEAECASKLKYNPPPHNDD